MFAIGSNPGFSLFETVRKLLCTYWQENDQLIDYYVFDYMVRLTVDASVELKRVLDTVPPNNKGIYHYQMHFNDPADLLPPEDTWLFKLSWKGNYNTATEDGKETLYGRWLRETEEML